MDKPLFLPNRSFGSLWKKHSEHWFQALAMRKKSLFALLKKISMNGENACLKGGKFLLMPFKKSFYIRSETVFNPFTNLSEQLKIFFSRFDLQRSCLCFWKSSLVLWKPRRNFHEFRRDFRKTAEDGNILKRLAEPPNRANYFCDRINHNFKNRTIMAEYRMREMPDLGKTGKQVKYPKMVIIQQLGLEHLAKEISESSSFTPGDVKGIVTALSQSIARLIAQGFSVKVDGLGTFSASLGLKEGTEPESVAGKRNATSIEMRGVNYRADKELIRRGNNICSLKRGHSRIYTDASTGEAERLAAALKHIREEGFLKVKVYAVLTGLSASTAGRELKAFALSGRLRCRGQGSHIYYLSPAEE